MANFSSFKNVFGTASRISFGSSRRFPFSFSHIILSPLSASFSLYLSHTKLCPSSHSIVVQFFSILSLCTYIFPYICTCVFPPIITYAFPFYHYLCLPFYQYLCLSFLSLLVFFLLSVTGLHLSKRLFTFLPFSYSVHVHISLSLSDVSLPIINVSSDFQLSSSCRQGY